MKRKQAKEMKKCCRTDMCISLNKISVRISLRLQWILLAFRRVYNSPDRARRRKTNAEWKRVRLLREALSGSPLSTL